MLIANSDSGVGTGTAGTGGPDHDRRRDLAVEVGIDSLTEDADSARQHVTVEQ